MKSAQLFCAFLLVQLILAPISAAIPVGPSMLTAVEGQNVEAKPIAVRKRATSGLLKGAAIGAVLGLAGAAAYNMYKNRQSTVPPSSVPDSGTGGTTK